MNNVESYDSAFYSEDDLRPISPSTVQTQQTLVSEKTVKKLNQIIEELRAQKRVIISFDRLKETPDILAFLDALRAIGSINIKKDGDQIILAAPSEYASNFNKTFELFVEHGLQIIDNWHTSRPIAKRLIGLQLLLFAEHRRVQQSVCAGFAPEIYKARPVAFAVIKAKSKRRKKDVYLFELNKNWHKYNLIGGKMEDCDVGDYQAAVLREIEEELGINRNLVKVSPLHDKEIISYGLTGNYGTLCKYPAIIYQALFSTPIQLRERFKWISLEEFKNGITEEGKEFMVSPFYRGFLLNRLEGGLESLPYSFLKPMDDLSLPRKFVEFLVKHKEIIVAILIILAAIIGVIRVIFWK